MKKALFILFLSLCIVCGANDCFNSPICQGCREITLINGVILQADSVSFNDLELTVSIYLEAKSMQIPMKKIYSICPKNEDSKLIIKTI